MPDIEIGLTVLQRPDGVLPVIDIVESLSVTHATTREAHEFRLQGRDGLSQVFAQSVLTMLESLLREEAHHIDARTGFLLSDDSQTGFVAGLLGCQYGLIALPA